MLLPKILAFSAIILLITSVTANVFDMSVWLSTVWKNYTGQEQENVHSRVLVMVPCRAGYARDRTGTCRKILKTSSNCK